jgi:hypothetical protein
MIGQYLYLAFSLGQLTPEFSTLLLQHHVLLLDLVKISLLSADPCSPLKVLTNEKRGGGGSIGLPTHATFEVLAKVLHRYLFCSIAVVTLALLQKSAKQIKRH